MHCCRTFDVVALVDAARQGSEEACAELYRRYRDLAASQIYRLVRRYEVTADLVQITFACVFRGLSTLRDPSLFVAWLIRIARHRACDWLRTHDREIVIFTADLPDVPDSHAGPLLLMELVEERELLDLGIARLPDNDRRLLQAFHHDRRSLQDIAAELGKPVGTIKRWLFESRRRLRQVVNDRRRLPHRAA
jgi:RNA polymerase sigma-70 factor (ECF subfamily)